MENSPASIQTPSIRVNIGQEQADQFLNIVPTKAKIKISMGAGDSQKITSDVSPLSKDKDAPQQQNRFERLNLLENQEGDLESRIQDDIINDFFNGEAYLELCNLILLGNLEDFNRLEKPKKIEFLIKLYQDSAPESEKILETILPFVAAPLIPLSFKFCSLNYLNLAKKVSLLKRLAPEQEKQSDQAIIHLLLSEDTTLISHLNQTTLSQLRQKEYLGNLYYSDLLKNRMKLSKNDFKKLSALSAKITTICYTHYLEKTISLFKLSREAHASLNEKLLSEVAGLSKGERKQILQRLQATNTLTASFETNNLLSPEAVKSNIEMILQEALKMKTTFSD